jgi:uncharacterized membrane protein
MSSAPTPQASSGMTNNVAAALCYLLGFITGIIFLVIEPYKNDKFVRFHAFQSIFTSLICMVVSWIVSAILVGMMLSGGMGFAFTLLRLFQLAIFVGFLFLMFKAYSNEKFKVPVIGDFAEKQVG